MNIGVLPGNKKWPWWLALTIVAVGVFLFNKGFKQWEQVKLPIYTLSQEQSGNQGFMKMYLSDNSSVYVRDYTELPLCSSTGKELTGGRTC